MGSMKTRTTNQQEAAAMLFVATHKATGSETHDIPADAEAHLLNTSLWCAAAQIAGLVDYLVRCPNAVAAESADFRVTRAD
jgi:hypothetical protein